jgi:hypothetical protein
VRRYSFKIAYKVVREVSDELFRRSGVEISNGPTAFMEQMERYLLRASRSLSMSGKPCISRRRRVVVLLRSRDLTSSSVK